MKNRRVGRLRAGLVLGVTAVLAAAIAGCGSGSGNSSGNGPVTLRFVWWGNDDRAKATRAAVDLFQTQNPTIKVVTEYSGYDAYFQKLSTQIAGGSSPDVLQLDRATLGEYEGRHVLSPLDSYVGKGLRTDGLSPQLLAGGKVAGKLYGVAGGQTSQMLVYDPAVFGRAGVTPPTTGWTWSQFTADLEKVGSVTGTPGSTDFGWAIDWFEVWLHQHGKQLYTDDGKLSFTARDLTDFWTMTGQMRAAKGLSAPEATTKMDGTMPNSALVTKKAASEINYDSSLTAYLSSYGAPLSAVALPSDGKSGMAAMPPVTFAVSQRSSHRDAAVKLADFLVNDPGAGKILGTTRGLPPNLSIRDQVCASATAATKAVCDYEKAAAIQIGPSYGLWPTGSAAIKRDFQTVYDDVIFGKTSVPDGAARVITDAKQSLQS
jgi:multiple sugar transport system substrate-binding protein